MQGRGETARCNHLSLPPKRVFPKPNPGIGSTQLKPVVCYLEGEVKIELSAKARGHSAGESTRQSGGTAASVCGESP
jgi:hypothetical protein